MAKDFFGSLGETLTKTAKELSGRAEEVYETQRLKNKISGEERQIEKAMADLGRIIYKRYKKEIPVDDAQKALCEQIDQRMEQIEKYKTDISELKVKNKRFCPSCGSPLAKDDAFCSQCGAACPTVEPEEDAGDDVIEGTAEEVAEETATEETDETVEEANADTAEDAVTTEETVEEAAEQRKQHRQMQKSKRKQRAEKKNNVSEINDLNK